MPYTVMPFGMHEGKFLDDVPSEHLCWCLRECDRMRPRLREAIEDELDRRRNEDCPEREEHFPVNLNAILRQWHRAMALRFHPDRGGSKDAMQAINAAVDRLKELLGAA